ncbi:uncharacterized protein AMSG_08787 [Thecamonas trahens ATCC 50062]|uniref:WW domain-containing protein n=1 Tax=Thecamonas trahens ATCC 50062 TaxID=461836 RepID=A0A0L0DM07_THETB|nr:hypothetical protein AMSG_08787 [Thecamonas trahens ATCC 50062]KNC53295.1 hypothetical protein AMSG_08787 [Thecamonas trahens ATCC 50062]|eukprot:XP_013754556.1 hypothetical protein AMSG_08787 [Thecamonas trahens ATCC 50062]
MSRVMQSKLHERFRRLSSKGRGYDQRRSRSGRQSLVPSMYTVDPLASFFAPSHRSHMSPERYTHRRSSGPRPKTVFSSRGRRPPDWRSASRWEERRHPLTGDPYYVDTFTGESSWEPPRHEVRRTSPAHTRRQQHDAVHARAHRRAQERRKAAARQHEARRVAEAEARRRALPEVRHASAIVIQAAVRGWLVRRSHILDHLRALRDVMHKVTELVREFEAKLANNTAREVDAVGLGEMLMHHGMLKLDSIPSHGSDLVRARRKSLVALIQRWLELVDSWKVRLAEKEAIEDAMRESPTESDTDNSPAPAPASTVPMSPHAADEPLTELEHVIVSASDSNAGDDESSAGDMLDASSASHDFEVIDVRSGDTDSDIDLEYDLVDMDASDAVLDADVRPPVPPRSFPVSGSPAVDTESDISETSDAYAIDTPVVTMKWEPGKTYVININDVDE